MWHRTKAFQGLRLLFFISIVALHCGNPICGNGGQLCSFFFLISGFLYTPKPSYKSYVKKKILTIFPIYYFCLFLFIFGRMYRGHGHIGWDIIPYLFLVQSWIPQFTYSSHYYLGPAWFLSSLIFCYLLSPLCHKFVSNNKCLTILGIPLLIIIIHTINWGEKQTWVTYYSPIERLFEYILGMSIGMFIKPVHYRKEPFAGFCLLVTVGYLACIRFLNFWWQFIFIHPIILSMIYLYESVPLNVVFANKLALRMASAGLFIYLSHNAIKMAVPGSWWVKTIVCTIVGWGLYELYILLIKIVKEHICHLSR